MSTRIEITKQLRDAYRTGSKAEKSAVLDTFCASTGLSRSTARRYLTSKYIGNRHVHRFDRRQCRPRKYSRAAQEKLLWLWRIMQMPCGKYLVASRQLWIEALEVHGELTLGRAGWTETVRNEILLMSAATIDRYLKEERERLQLKGISTTRAGALLRNSITIRKAGDEMEGEPGFFEADTVAHCGPTLKGIFARTLTMTDVHLGWIELQALANNARTHVLKGLDNAIGAIPYLVQGLDCDNGSEFINHDVIKWATERDIYFTRARPYRKNDQAHVESKNNHAVRRYGFHYRYDTDKELDILNKLWRVVCIKLNYFTPTKKPIGWSQDISGRRKRMYDEPKTPSARLLDSGILSTTQIEELTVFQASINPATLTRDILRYQTMLMAEAKNKTAILSEEVELARSRRKQRLTGGIRVNTG